MFKLLFIGGRQGSALHPLKGLLKKSLKNPQNFQKRIILQYFLKVFGDPRTFANFAAGKFAPSVSEEVFKKVLSRRRPCLLTDKPQFEHYAIARMIERLFQIFWRAGLF